MLTDASLAQSPPAESAQPAATPPSPAKDAAPAQPSAAAAAPAVPAAPVITAKDLEGLDVFGSEGRQVGKVSKVNEGDGKVKNIEVQSSGYFGFFKKTYVVPFDAVKKKDGKIELSLTSGDVSNMTR
jgi:sporulation protein YlmC with PRC-barrel domain